MKNIKLSDIGYLGNNATSITIDAEISDGSVVSRAILFREIQLENSKLGTALALLGVLREIQEIERKAEKSKV